MNRPSSVILLLGFLGLTTLVFLLQLFASERVEVVDLHTLDQTSKEVTTRLWVVDDGGYQYLRVGSDGSDWFTRLQAAETVDITRNNRRYRYSWAIKKDKSEAINHLMRRKYGWGDAFIGALTGGRVGSIPIVAILSIFMGAVTLLQMAYNFSSPLVPDYTEGLATRDTMILEFAPTIISLILAGKVGSSIAGNLGTMKVTEQIDALEIMGVNPQSYLIMPKMVAALCVFPFIVIVSIFLGTMGGYLASLLTGVVSIDKYVYGIRYDFEPFYITYALVKAEFFAMIITSVSAYQGFITSGGPKEVGDSITRAVVYSCIIILLFDLILTQLLLTA